jgi:hypothetical protein
MAAAGCTDTASLEDDIDALTARIDELNASAQESALLNAVDILDSAGLHDIDEGANDNNEIPGGASGGVNRALVAVATTSWPEELQAGATEMQAALEALLTALETEDPATVGPPATTAHDAQHGFSESVLNHLKEGAGLPVEEHEEEPAEGTPAESDPPPEGETPAEGEEHEEEEPTPTTAA